MTVFDIHDCELAIALKWKKNNIMFIALISSSMAYHPDHNYVNHFAGCQRMQNVYHPGNIRQHRIVDYCVTWLGEVNILN